jgi:uncharacterized integral membrane protein
VNHIDGWATGWMNNEFAGAMWLWMPIGVLLLVLLLVLIVKEFK